MLKILLVCTGNTCRSPMAATLLTAKVAAAGLAGDIVVESAGIAAWCEPASAPARAVMSSFSLNLDNHCSRQLKPAILETADLVLTMTAGHKRAVKSMAPAVADKLYALAEFADEAGDVADPFGGSQAEYQACARQLDRLFDKCLGKIIDMAGKK